MTNLPSARILAIETSCDETACAVLENGRVLLGSVVASQMDIHSRYGGVFPEVASRQHILSIVPVVEETLAKAHITLKDVDAIAVTRGPGLAGSLIVGVNAAKGLALGTGLPLVGVNHLEGHLYSAWVYNAGESTPIEPEFPLMVLLVSGGHTELDLMTDHLQYEHLGSTLDDAAGEAFDKVARLLGLGYPGGPAIQKAADEGAPTRFNFPRAWLEDTWDFSFSGIKTAVMREEKGYQSKGRSLPVPRGGPSNGCQRPENVDCGIRGGGAKRNGRRNPRDLSSARRIADRPVGCLRLKLRSKAASIQNSFIVPLC